MTLTPRKHVEQALFWKNDGLVPFTIYESKIPQCAAERQMRNQGMCIVNRLVPVYAVTTPNVRQHQEIYWEEEKKLTRTWYETPAGVLTTLTEAAGFTSWSHEKMFKSADDYKALAAYLADMQVSPCYEGFKLAEERYGDDAIFRVSLGLEPLQMLISGGLIDMQQFCLEWMDNRDELLKLYAIVVEKRRQIYPLVAESPVLTANYGGNVTPEIIGPEVFRDYYLPHYNEAAAVLHQKGKLIGCHFDDDCGMLASLIAQTDLDYIEAFTPAPDTDMTLAQARKAWPDKVLWLNFPSSLHLKSDAEITAATVAMLRSLPHTNGLIMGVTEDVPEHRWRHSCPAIMEGLRLAARA